MGTLDRISALIKARGWSANEFSRRLGVSSAMKNWRAGRSSPDKHLPRIADVLGTTESYLRGETDDPSPEDIGEIDRQTIIELKRLGVIRPDGTADPGMLEAFNLMLEARKRIPVEGAREDK